MPAAVTDLRLFREPERARRDLERLRESVPGPVYSLLSPLLADSSNPDQALNLFERLADESGIDLTTLLSGNGALLHYAIVIFGHSYWLGETLLRNVDLLQGLSRERQLDRSLEHEDYHKRLTEFRVSTANGEISAMLARFKKREYVRIALRDILGIATLGETTAEISALADVIIQEALQEAAAEIQETRAAQPGEEPSRNLSGFAVLALGKLGGNELNYSSDVDLMYVYDGRTSSGVLEREDFVRQAQVLTGILSRATPEGAVFRIDLRLRPEGSEGETAVALGHALDYYRRVAHDWELQALIKARYAAGDAAVARAFLRGVREQVYTDGLNFAAIETALRSRQKMDSRRRRTIRADMPDVKRDRGGIRDIEFLVQCLQRVYGGREPWLRSGGTLASLQKLHDKDHLGSRDFHELSLGYAFLRKVEHRLQLQRGGQVHRLPESAVDIEILNRALGEAGDPHRPPLLPLVESWMAKVSRIYERVIHTEQGEGGRWSSLDESMGQNPGRQATFDHFIDRVRGDSGELAGILARAHLSPPERRDVQRFFSSLTANPESYAAMRANPQLLVRVLTLLANSEYLTEMLVRYPESARVLEDGAAFGQPTEIPPGVDSTESMRWLRREFRSRMFAEAASDILAPRPVLDCMRETSQLADSIIRSALRAVDGNDRLAVFALGRLGTEEFDIASDADLIFVRDPSGEAERARVIAEKLVHVLSAYTRDGTVFAVDARLRPRGGEGELVVTSDQLESYLALEAQPWEALTYSKLRFVAGKEGLAPQLLSSVRQRIVDMARQEAFAQAVLEMRSRLEKSNRYAHSFKLARGGFYDIDFMVSFLMLTKASLGGGNTLERMKHLSSNGFLDQKLFAKMERATVLYRTLDHVIRLVTGRARPELPEAEHAREATEKLVNRILEREPSHDLQAELEDTQSDIRRIFLGLIGA